MSHYLCPILYVEIPLPDKSIHKLAVEAKDWGDPVGVHVMNDHVQIVDVCKRRNLIHSGAIVSLNGFTKPARLAADAHNITLHEESDLESMTKQELTKISFAPSIEEKKVQTV